MRSKGKKSISPDLKAKDNPNNVTAIGKEITSKLDQKNDKPSPNILLTQSLSTFNRKDFIQKLFKGDLPPKSGKNTSILQNFIWEYAIVLPNPDYPNQLNEAVTSETSEKFYKECFRPKKSGNIHKDNLVFLQEVQAFNEVYKTLNDINDGKALLGGGKLSMEGENVYDHGSQAKDFTTLVRNALFYKLVCSLGLTVKQMVSKSGEHIYFVITADENDLMIEAERIQSSKQLEIALTDMQSLLPCDESLRPLHILKNNDSDIRNTYKEIKPFLTRALGLSKNAEKVEFKLDPEGVTPRMWNAYKIYLTLLKDGIQKITSSVKTHKAQMFLFQKLIRDSMAKANLGLSSRHQLKDLWTRLEIEKPIAPYAEFRRSTKEDELGDKWRTHEIDESGKRSLFRNMERIRLIVSFIETEVKINFLQDKGFIVAHFPMKNLWQLKGQNLNAITTVPEEDRLLRNILYDLKPVNRTGPLLQSWNSSLINQKIPLQKVRNYFGEKIALYFEFLKFHQRSLLLPSLIGLAVFVMQRLYDKSTTQVLALNAFYSVFITMWAVVFLEAWKRKEASLSILWGTTDFEKVEVPRPQYTGNKRRSPVTDDLEEIHYPESKRHKFVILAFTVSFTIILLVIGAVVALTIFKIWLDTRVIVSNFNLAGPVCSVINAVQIQIFNFIYSKLAVIMTNLENHKTEDQHQNSYVWKVFAFQFVNSFNSLVYIAFIKGYYGGGCLTTQSNGSVIKGTDCINELYVQLISLFVVAYLKDLAMILIDYISYRKKRKTRSKSKVGFEGKVKDVRDMIEAQVSLDYYVSTGLDGTINDYMASAIQFGYLTLFALAFPLSSLLVFFLLWFEMLTGKLKLISLVRRPVPFSAKDIGTWQGIFEIITVLSIFSNSALFVFTSNTFQNISYLKDYSQIIFGGVVILLLLFRSLLQSCIPDVPARYQTVLERHENVVEKVLRGEVKPIDAPDPEVIDTGLYFSSLSSSMTQVNLA